MFKVVALISGSGSLLPALLEASFQLNFSFKLVIADRNCEGINRAQLLGLSTQLIAKNNSNFSLDLINSIPKDTNVIFLLGFLSILDVKLIKTFNKKIINIHPSLLPKYGGAGMYGLRVHQAVIDSKEEYSGCSVHYVNEQVDGGDIIWQEKVALNKVETVESLKAKIFDLENKAIYQVMRSLVVDSGTGLE